MAPTPLYRRFVGLVLLALGVSALLSFSASAQDRSVPRFGPLVSPDTVTADRFDTGRLWSFASPPLDYFEEAYDVRANERGLRHARLGTVRLPDCSGTLVSPEGLVLTAARCVRAYLSAESDDSLRVESFYADSPSQERALSGLYAEQVVAVEEVTALVDSAASGAGDRIASSGWEEGMATVEQQRQAEAGANQRVEVVREAGGRRYVAYTYRRYEDVRLAFVPDRGVSVSGRLGTPLTYPQHAWDVAVLRLYENDQPVQTPQHFEVRDRGTRPGDAVFAVAHPSETQRMETHEQLAFRRDVSLPATQAVQAVGTERLRQYVDTAQAAGAAWEDRLTEAQMALRQTRARLEGLENEYVMARLRSRDQQLRQAMASESARAIDRLADLQEEKRALAPDYRAFSFLLHPAHSSATLRRALLVHREQEGDTSSTNASLEASLSAVSSQPAALDAAALADHLEHLRAHLETDSSLVKALPDAESAPSLLEASIFSDAEQVRARLQKNEIPADDPVLNIVSGFYDRYISFRQAWDDLRMQERGLTDTLAGRRHQALELPVALPQGRSLRIADGRVQGYPYNGTVAPPFTTFYGLYERHYALRTVQGEGSLPRRWQTPAETFSRATPLTTAANTDLGGGAYGGALLNTSLQLVGVVFDGNVQSATGTYLFLPDRMRAVAVDVRGILEGLSSVYEADRLVQEMTEERPSQ